MKYHCPCFAASYRIIVYSLLIFQLLLLIKTLEQPSLIWFHRLTTLEKEKMFFNRSREMYSPYNWAASSSPPAAVPNTITAVYWLCLRGSGGTRNTCTESMNLRKTPLSFPETGGLDVFISTTTPWPGKMKNNVLEVTKRVFVQWREHTPTQKESMLWSGRNTRYSIFIKRKR